MNQVLLLLLGTLKAGWIEGKTPEEDKYFYIQGRVKNKQFPKHATKGDRQHTVRKDIWKKALGPNTGSDCSHNSII